MRMILRSERLNGDVAVKRHGDSLHCARLS
jgi:hypothetical protein